MSVPLCPRRSIVPSASYILHKSLLMAVIIMYVNGLSAISAIDLAAHQLHIVHPHARSKHSQNFANLNAFQPVITCSSSPIILNHQSPPQCAAKRDLLLALASLASSANSSENSSNSMAAAMPELSPALRVLGPAFLIGCARRCGVGISGGTAPAGTA